MRGEDRVAEERSMSRCLVFEMMKFRVRWPRISRPFGHEIGDRRFDRLFNIKIISLKNMV